MQKILGMIPSRWKSSPWLPISFLLTALPIWCFEFLPLQDFPAHLATLSVFHNYHNPAYGFDKVFTLEIGNTQYLLLYVLGHLLSYVFSIKTSLMLLLTLYVVGTPFAIEKLLVTLGKDPSLALLSIPLIYNAMFLYGLLPFLLGIPFFFWGINLLILIHNNQYRNMKQLLALSACMVAMFYSHIFVYGLFGIVFTVFLPLQFVSMKQAFSSRLTLKTKWIIHCLIAVPSLLAFLFWISATQSGALVMSTFDSSAPVTSIQRDLFEKWTLLPSYMLNIFTGHNDEALLIYWFTAVFLLLATPAKKLNKHLQRCLFLPVVSFILYFVMKDNHDYIAYIAARFVILSMFLAIPFCTIPRAWLGNVVRGGLLFFALSSIANVHQHFSDFQQEAVGFNHAIKKIPMNKKTCGLIFNSKSSVMINKPFVHFVSYVQAFRGGVVNFSFAGYTHWPVGYQPGKFPPPGGPKLGGWEWSPSDVPLEGEIHPYYDYVLTRGEGFEHRSKTRKPLYKQIHSDSGWAVWQRIS